MRNPKALQTLLNLLSAALILTSLSSPAVAQHFDPGQDVIFFGAGARHSLTWLGDPARPPETITLETDGIVEVEIFVFDDVEPDIIGPVEATYAISLSALKCGETEYTITFVGGRQETGTFQVGKFAVAPTSISGSGTVFVTKLGSLRATVFKASCDGPATISPESILLESNETVVEFRVRADSSLGAEGSVNCSIESFNLDGIITGEKPIVVTAEPQSTGSLEPGSAVLITEEVMGNQQVVQAVFGEGPIRVEIREDPVLRRTFDLAGKSGECFNATNNPADGWVCEFVAEAYEIIARFRNNATAQVEVCPGGAALSASANRVAQSVPCGTIIGEILRLVQPFITDRKGQRPPPGEIITIFNTGGGRRQIGFIFDKSAARAQIRRPELPVTILAERELFITVPGKTQSGKLRAEQTVGSTLEFVLT